ncbi:unnamed protein product [Adineta steineri]|uniref:Uncharacterized protein n=1 Tax=Adineta steineri TaxID=433720 RepID=A0A814VHL8_9BILA|nr:unnamed protein product [Adineta steineri]
MRHIILDVIQFRHQHKILVPANMDLQSKIEKYLIKQYTFFSSFLWKQELRIQYDQLVHKSQSLKKEIRIAKERVDTLENTMPYQERVIEKLQVIISNYIKKNLLYVFVETINDIDRTLLTEYAALSVEIKRFRNQGAQQGHPTVLVNNSQQGLVTQTQAHQIELEQQNSAF